MVRLLWMFMSFGTTELCTCRDFNAQISKRERMEFGDCVKSLYIVVRCRSRCKAHRDIQRLRTHENCNCGDYV